MRLPTLSPLVRTALAAAPLLLLTAAPAGAQFVSREAIELHNQVYQLQQEVQALRQQLARQGGSGPTYPGGGAGGGYSGQPANGDLVAQLLQRVNDLDDQVRQLRGQVQEADNKLQQQSADLNKRMDDLAFQVQHPGAAPGEAPGGTQAMAAPAAPATSPPPAALGATRAPAAAVPAAPPVTPRTAEAALREGTAALERRDYAASETAAREVLSKFRTSPRAYDAQYLLAESLQGQRRYPQAAIAYDDVYNRARKGAHAQQSLIGLAASLTAINEKKAACDTLSKLHTEFPHQSAAIHQAADALHQRAGCR